MCSQSDLRKLQVIILAFVMENRQKQNKNEVMENRKKENNNENNTDKETQTLNNNEKDYPLKDIPTPLDHDVIFGRGNGTNRNPGNKLWRKMVESRKVEYQKAPRHVKTPIALDIVHKWRELEPPGRFLEKDKETGLWHEVGDDLAKKKTIQALRENAKQIRTTIQAAEGTEPPKKKRKSTIVPKVPNWKTEVNDNPVLYNQGTNNAPAQQPWYIRSGMFEYSSIATMEEHNRLASEIQSRLAHEISVKNALERYVKNQSRTPGNNNENNTC